MKAFKGQVRQMLRHAEASSVVEYAYNDKAILPQRLMLTEELYGNTFQVCKVGRPPVSRGRSTCLSKHMPGAEYSGLCSWAKCAFLLMETVLISLNH